MTASARSAAQAGSCPAVAAVGHRIACHALSSPPPGECMGRSGKICNIPESPHVVDIVVRCRPSTKNTMVFVLAAPTTNPSPHVRLPTVTIGYKAGSGLVLVLNSGSSSVKCALPDPGRGDRVLAGQAEQVGTPQAVLHVRRAAGGEVTENLGDGSYQAVISRILGPARRQSDRGRSPGGPRRRPVH
jgi:hypothetical protein